MPVIRVTEEMMLGEVVNEAAMIEVSSNLLLSETEIGTAMIEVSSEQLLSEIVFGGAMIEVSEIVFLGIREVGDVPVAPFREFFSPATGY